MNLTLKVWRQQNAADKGKFVTYKAEGISPEICHSWKCWML
jgi:succinate dehydrogenase / fumarate reductase, iron-sulfur subunit